MSDTSSDNGKTVAIISYITPIGWIIAFIMNNNDKTDFGSYHIRQALGIFLAWFLLGIINSYLSIAILGWIVELGLIVFCILGLIGAIQGEKNPIPLLGAQFQEWFKSIG
ncbi:MAG: putative membrane protein [Flavobacteriaceae bacterium]|jgi:uncharacterized membrane protein